MDNKADILLELLEDVLGEPAHHYPSKSQITFDCPSCAEEKGIERDGKGNLEINYESGVYQCWACSESNGTKGYLFNIFKNYADKQTLKKYYDLKYEFNSDYYSDKPKQLTENTLKLPPEYIPLCEYKNLKILNPAYNYLYNRGITDEQIKKHKIGFCLDGIYQNRVVIPSYDEDKKLNYFVTRAISKRVKKYKYLNPEVDKTEIIFDEYLIDWDKPITLVEGVFDHIPIPNSIPLLGKKLYIKLFSKIYKKANNYIIIALDPDAWADIIKIYNKLDAGRLYKKVLICKTPPKYDISLFNQVYGKENLKKLLTTSARLKE